MTRHVASIEYDKHNSLGCGGELVSISNVRSQPCFLLLYISRPSNKSLYIFLQTRTKFGLDPHEVNVRKSYFIDSFIYQFSSDFNKY